MKTRLFPLAAATLLAISSTSVVALTLPVAQDSYISTSGSSHLLYPSSGNAVSLPVDARNTALITFDLNNPDAVPPSITGSNVTSAILQLYIIRSSPVGDLTIHAVTSSWAEHFTGKSLPAPTIDPTVLATIPASAIGKKDFVTVDLTAPIIDALNSGDTNGFAIETSGTTKIVLASKEGAATGYSAQLDIETTNGSPSLSGSNSQPLHLAIGAVTSGSMPAVTVSGTDSDFTLSFVLQPGAAGLTGSTGVAGPQGPAGPTGATGLTGSTGSQGTQGSQGATGIQGPAGPADSLTIGTVTGGTSTAVTLTGTSPAQNLNFAIPNGQLPNFNTAIGAFALISPSGGSNAAFGYRALNADTSGGDNTAMGDNALSANTSGAQNTAAGDIALGANTSGANDTAFGASALSENTTGSNNTALGEAALLVNDSGQNNTAAGASSLVLNTSGSQNSAFGVFALFANTSGSNNTAFGYEALENSTASGSTATGAFALQQNTTGIGNSAFGLSALSANTTGSSNTALGFGALSANTSAYGSVAVGYQALVSNTTAANTAVGFQALYSNTQGFGSTAIGYQALFSNTNGVDNTAVGIDALYASISGGFNEAFGAGALSQLVSGAANVAVGTSALGPLVSGDENTAVGDDALGFLTSGFDNVAIGHIAGAGLTTATNEIIIGATYGEAANESNTIRLGDASVHTRAFIAGIRGETTGQNNAVEVLIDSNGQLGTTNSSRRFKEDIADMADASDRILKLRPVTFRYKQPYDNGEKPIQFGLIAEEVAQVFPELVVYDSSDQPQTVKYQLLAPLLLNEFLKEHKQVEAQAQVNAAQAKTIAEQQKQIEALTASMEKMTHRMDAVAQRLDGKDYQPAVNLTGNVPYQ